MREASRPWAARFAPWADRDRLRLRASGVTALFMTRRRVLFGECDPGGVVYTPRFADYVAEAILAFLTDRLGAPAERRLAELGVLSPGRALSIEFLRPLTWDDEVVLRVAVVRMSTRSITYAVEALTLDGEVAFRSRLTQVCVSAETKRPVGIPEALR
jgi:YbgC/YbaW family acyl-CoA thioester hydrolase